MADKLTPQQAMAVENRGGKLLVSAAAGSGKTKVLVDRLLAYLTDPVNPADLDDFLIITYTKAAASELRAKIASKLTERIAQEPENRHLQKQMQRLYLTHISTVHGFCTNLLREYAYRLDLSADFRVADEGECAELRETVMKDLLDRVYENLTENDAFHAFVDSQGVGRNDSQVPEIIQKVYDSARCHLDPDKWLSNCLTENAPEGKQDASETVWGSYLIARFRSVLEGQIGMMKRCAEEAGEYPELVKVTANLEATIAQLEKLCGLRTWDEIAGFGKLDYGTLRFPKNNPDLALAESIKAVREECKKSVAELMRWFSNDSSQIFRDLDQSYAAAQGLVELVRQFDRDYSQAKRSRRVLDFSDLEHRTLDLLLGKNRSTPTVAAQEISRRFREILVDEYQDSNGVQDAIFSVLTRERENCFMVGDVKQSIYRFRLADPSIFLEKYRSYEPAETALPGAGRKILLSHNFRSGPEVIEGINDVFRCCMSEAVGGLEYGEDEQLREGVPHIPLPDAAVELYALETSEDTNGEEAAFVADRIRRMLDDNTVIRSADGLRPVRPEDIVILLRSPGSVGWEYQAALENAGIRCAVDGGMDLLDTEEIAALRSFLQTIANPRQDIPLLGILASPVFGFTADELAQIRGARHSGYVFDSLRQSSLPKAVSFLRTLESLRAEARMSPLTQLLERCITLTRMDSVYGAMPGGKVRKQNIQSFFQLAAGYESGGLRSLDQFLDYLDTMSSAGLAGASAGTAGCVTIMSIHKSKGLEFPVVFLSALARKFNQEDLRESVLCDKDLGLGLMVVDNKTRIRYSSISKRAIAASMRAESVSEEMRVLYVAMTRARDRLIMTFAAKKLENRIQEIGLRLPFDVNHQLSADASCPGDWILAAALQHTEAGELHSVGGKPRQTRIGQFPWKIHLVNTVSEQPAVSVIEDTEEAVPQIPVEDLRAALSFRYPHMAATMAPSKQTATGRKGSSRAEEAAENTAEKVNRIHSWRKPFFREATRDGREYGNAFHSAMQFIRYENCTDKDTVQREILRLVEEGYLSEEESTLVSADSIAAFFDSPVGRKLRGGTEYLREFKFSILDEGVRYGDGLEGEKVLLQGVVDCALLEPDGITIVDFKTDRVTEDSLQQAAERHRIQLETYAQALSRIYECPIKARFLYFVRRNCIVEL